MIQLIVGLGNPGVEYQTTRHNVGFCWLDRLAAVLKVTWHSEARFYGQLAYVHLPQIEKATPTEFDERHRVYLLKPNTFMNRSGQSVAALSRFYEIAAQHILVVHDDLDLVPGIIKLKYGGSNGGHNGLKDISAHLANADYWRLRIGIGHPRTLNCADFVVNFVLKTPPVVQQQTIDQAIARSLEVFPLLLYDQQRAMQFLHRA